MTAILASEQCRAARAWLGMSQDELAQLSGVSRRTIAWFEGGERVPHARTLRDLVGAFKKRGIEPVFDENRPVGLRVIATPSEA